MEVRFKDIIVEGRLGPLTPNLSIERVEEFLGAPGDISATNNPLTWKFGALQVTFHNGEVSLIAMYFNHIWEALPFTFSDCALNQKTSMESLVKMLDDVGVQHEIVPTLTFDDQLGLRVQFSRVRVDVVFADKILYGMFISS